ncbi:acetoacetate decarboxylase family protein [Sorangium sp. So ce381]|uniref:acetoacetate decarboxylase family protein n=1 Tax=Sorangium sp. So ce381 TaxID=3133307 RepID=UPI003F5B6128
MSQSAGSHPPDVKPAPAPWTLAGDATIVMLELPGPLLEEQSFIPEALRPRFEGRYSLLMALDYASSNVGPYRELLFIPGRFRTRRGLCWSISKIYVSSWDSVVNGQRNWGIPKEHADFEIAREADGSERFRASQGGEVFADLRFAAAGPSLPASSALVPARLRRLVHHRDGHDYFCAPTARGSARHARLIEARVDPARMPRVDEGRVVFAARLSRFQAEFPVADVELAPSS